MTLSIRSSGICYWVTQTFAVDAATMRPLGTPSHTFMGCAQADFGPTETDPFETMLQSDISFELVSPGHVTLSGSGLLLRLQAEQ